MNKIKNVILTLTCATMISGAFAQTATPPPSTGTSISAAQDPKALNDPAVSQRLSADLNSRNAQLGTNSVSWFDAGNGYYGTYTVGTNNYMTRYDRQGNYIETYTKGNWSDSTVPPSLMTSYNESMYKGQPITGYWTVSDPGKSGYYLEVQGKDGKTGRIYADENGKFLSAPRTAEKPRP